MTKKRKRYSSAAGEDEGTVAAKKAGEKKYKYRKKCSADGCSNIAVQGGVCMRHGAKTKRCSSDGCANQAKTGGVCIRHGAKTKPKRCSSDGCTNYAQKGGVCIRHGAKRKLSMIVYSTKRIGS
eukprot:scaffold14642_cov146-Skeletonema_menzelii.AAC.4